MLPLKKKIIKMIVFHIFKLPDYSDYTLFYLMKLNKMIREHLETISDHLTKYKVMMDLNYIWYFFS